MVLGFLIMLITCLLPWNLRPVVPFSIAPYTEPVIAASGEDASVKGTTDVLFVSDGLPLLLIADSSAKGISSTCGQRTDECHMQGCFRSSSELSLLSPKEKPAKLGLWVLRGTNKAGMVGQTRGVGTLCSLPHGFLVSVSKMRSPLPFPPDSEKQTLLAGNLGRSGPLPWPLLFFCRV